MFLRVGRVFGFLLRESRGENKFFSPSLSALYFFPLPSLPRFFQARSQGATVEDLCRGEINGHFVRKIRTSMNMLVSKFRFFFSDTMCSSVMGFPPGQPCVDFLLNHSNLYEHLPSIKDLCIQNLPTFRLKNIYILFLQLAIGQLMPKRQKFGGNRVHFGDKAY